MERLRNPPAVYIPENQTKAVSNLAANIEYRIPKIIVDQNSTSHYQIPKTDITEEDEIGFDAVEAAMSVLTIDKDREKAKDTT